MVEQQPSEAATLIRASAAPTDAEARPVGQSRRGRRRGRRRRVRRRPLPVHHQQHGRAEDQAAARAHPAAGEDQAAGLDQQEPRNTQQRRIKKKRNIES